MTRRRKNVRDGMTLLRGRIRSSKNTGDNDQGSFGYLKGMQK